MLKSKNQKEDVGFSVIGGGVTKPSINKDGSFNVLKTGNTNVHKDIFHYLISINIYKFILILIVYYTIINFTFGFIYFQLGMDHFTIHRSNSDLSNFLNSLFFSFQTFGTLGYGYISPISIISNAVVVFEIFLGLLSVALLAGLVFARFSKPKTRILFSNNVIIHNKDSKNKTLKFKLVNKRNSIMLDTELRVIYALKDPTTEIIKFYPLELEVNKITFFPLTWTVVHKIDESSPMKNINEKNYHDLNPELLIRVKGFDDKYHQIVYANFSYNVLDWVWNKTFEKNFQAKEDGTMHMNVQDVHNYY